MDISKNQWKPCVWSNQTFWQMWIKIKFRRFCHESTKSIFYWIKVCFAARFEDHLTVYDCFQCAKTDREKPFFRQKSRVGDSFAKSIRIVFSLSTQWRKGKKSFPNHSRINQKMKAT